MTKDPRRFFTDSDRKVVFARQQGMCGGLCGLPLPDSFHMHHVVPHTSHGPTTLDNALAVCPDCHRSAPTASMPQFVPRKWQSEALGAVLPLLLEPGFATIDAAPGAGKTLFVCHLFANLRARKAVGRMVVLVPNANLKTQWQDTARAVGIHLDDDNIVERRGRDGITVTYHTLLTPEYIHAMVAEADRLPTLYVLDEVHHLGMRSGGDAKAWALNADALVGNRHRPTARVLNLTGTLFRSNLKERISTVRYVDNGDGTIDAEADYSITAKMLQEQGHLRDIKLLSFDHSFNLQAVNFNAVTSASPDSLRVVDLNAQPPAVRKAALEAMFCDRDNFIQPMLKETIKRISQASLAVGGQSPMKALVVAHSQENARVIYEVLGERFGDRHAMLAISDDPQSGRTIERFRKSEDQAILVSVQMVTEGFDVPDVAVLTYMHTWTAPLFVNQLVARAMRVTDRERDLGIRIPATVLIPNDQGIVTAFANILSGPMQLITPSVPCPTCGLLVCACPPMPVNKQCDRCGMPWTICVCPCGVCGLTRAEGCHCPRRRPVPLSPTPGIVPTVDIDLITSPELSGVNMNGEDVSLGVFHGMEAMLAANGVPEIYAGNAALGFKRMIEADPMLAATWIDETLKGESA